MKKHTKKLALVTAVTLVLSAMTMVAFAASPVTASATAVYGCNATGQRACYTLMWDDDGTLVSRDVFEERYDAAVEYGDFLAADKDYFLEMYDYCSDMVLNGLCGRANGGGCGANGGRGMGGCGRR